MECGSVHGCDSTKSLPTQKSQRKKGFFDHAEMAKTEEKERKFFPFPDGNVSIIWE